MLDSVWIHRHAPFLVVPPVVLHAIAGHAVLGIPYESPGLLLSHALLLLLLASWLRELAFYLGRAKHVLLPAFQRDARAFSWLLILYGLLLIRPGPADFHPVFSSAREALWLSAPLLAPLLLVTSLYYLFRVASGGR